MFRFQTCPFLVLLLALGLAATASAQGERGVIAGVVSRCARRRPARAWQSPSATSIPASRRRT